MCARFVNIVLVLLLFVTALSPIAPAQTTCGYRPGDINNDTRVTAVADMVYFMNYLRGDAPPPVDCALPIGPCDLSSPFYAACDVNATCSFNGIDVTYYVTYWRSFWGEFLPCPTCPPDTLGPIDSTGIDPGAPDSIILGNLDGSAMRARPNQILMVPIWVKNDEDVPALSVSIATDSQFVIKGVGYNAQNPIDTWGQCFFDDSQAGYPVPGWANQTLRAYSGDNVNPPHDFLNTQGNYSIIAYIGLWIDPDTSNVGDTTLIMPGTHFWLGKTAFCDLPGEQEWYPAVIPGKLVIINNVCGAYVAGDVNNDTRFNGLDVTYSVSYLKGGPPPPYACECPFHSSWYVAGDVNATCDFNGLDVTYMIYYFKGGPGPQSCPDCPGMQ